MAAGAPLPAVAEVVAAAEAEDAADADAEPVDAESADSEAVDGLVEAESESVSDEGTDEER